MPYIWSFFAILGIMWGLDVLFGRTASIVVVLIALCVCLGYAALPRQTRKGVHRG